jgi:hypothetical protein
MLAWVSPQSRGRKSSKPVRRQASSRVASSASRLREPEFRDGRDVIVKNLALLADVAAVPSAYDAEALVSVLVGYLIQAGIPEPGLARMMLDVIDELRRRDADHSYPALRALAGNRSARRDRVRRRRGRSPGGPGCGPAVDRQHRRRHRGHVPPGR